MGINVGINIPLGKSRWEKRREEEEEKARKRELTRARIYGVPADHEVLEEVKAGNLSAIEARNLYRQQDTEKKTKEAEAEAPFKLQSLTEKGKPAGGKPPSYVTQQLIKEKRRQQRPKEQAAVQQKTEDEGLAISNLVGKGWKLENATRFVKTRSGALPQQAFEPLSLSKVKAATAFDPHKQTRKQAVGRIKYKYDPDRKETQREFLPQIQQTVGTFEEYYQRTKPTEFEVVQKLQAQGKDVTSAIAKVRAKYDKAIKDGLTKAIEDERLKQMEEVLIQMPYAPGTIEENDEVLRELLRILKEEEKLNKEMEQEIRGLSAGNTVGN